MPESDGTIQNIYVILCHFTCTFIQTVGTKTAYVWVTPVVFRIFSTFI